MDDILRFLSLINYALGIAIGGVALYEYKSHHNITPMLIILAVVIAGPLRTPGAHGEENPFPGERKTHPVGGPAYQPGDALFCRWPPNSK